MSLCMTNLAVLLYCTSDNRVIGIYWYWNADITWKKGGC